MCVNVETREQLAGMNSLSIVAMGLNLAADAPAEQSVRLVHGTYTTAHVGCQPWHQMPSTTVPSPIPNCVLQGPQTCCCQAVPGNVFQLLILLWTECLVR